VTRTLLRRPVTRLTLVLGLALALSGMAIALAPGAHEQDTVSAASRTNRAAFHDAMRELWEDHIVWTRMVIVSSVNDLPDTSTAVDRLLRNQDDIGDAIKPFYGEAAGEKLSLLLRDHIVVAADVVTAAKAGNSAGVEAALAEWYVNADAIGAFLADANPRNWDRADMQAMMRDHLDLTLTEAVARLEGRYADDAAAYDAIHSQILHMADMLSDGIVAQFPGRFGR
jgi:hypothetical protein